MKPIRSEDVANMFPQAPEIAPGLTLFALHAAGRTQGIAEPRRLDQVNDSFDEVLGGRAEARLVFRF